jgi:MFS family permease
MLAPFGVRSFRFQWPADLATSCAFEMETIALGWFILVETRSVLLLTVFASLQYIGTLFAPLVGLLGDRISHKTLLCAMRATYLALAALICALSFAGLLGPTEAFAVAAIAGLVRASDAGVRNVLTGETMPQGLLVGAMGLSRVTHDSARALGALAGAGLVAALGMSGAYVCIVALYGCALALTLGTGTRRGEPTTRPPRREAASPLADLVVAIRIVWSLPPQLAVMSLAFLINIATYPFMLGLLPYVAREVYGTSQAGLGWMVAASAGGCVAASILLSVLGNRVLAGRMMIGFAVLWQLLTIALGHTGGLATGIPLLLLTGIVQGLCMVPMSVIQLRHAPPELRGRIAGLRTLAVYGLPLGLWISGPLIGWLGFAGTTLLYGLVGLACTLAMLLRWHAVLWPAGAEANR